MPEGHVIHRLARRFNTDFRPAPVSASSPQGRFEPSLIDGTPLTHAAAHGKHLFLHFTDAMVHVHLGLIGKFSFEPADTLRGQIRLRLVPDGGAGDIAAHLRGPQTCAYITPAEQQAILDAAGEDPLSPSADPDALFERVRRSRRTIGSLMMDQAYFAGVGNIYRAEPLFRQGISPFTPGRELGRERFDAIWADLVALMADGVATGRIDTVRPEHLPEAMERAPREDDHGGEVYVYRRTGEPCHVCGHPVDKQQFEGRNLFFCPSCQAL